MRARKTVVTVAVGGEALVAAGAGAVQAVAEVAQAEVVVAEVADEHVHAAVDTPGRRTASLSTQCHWQCQVRLLARRHAVEFEFTARTESEFNSLSTAAMAESDLLLTV
jgi:REP element-mobilizing transposase RayT